jgi:gamma-butyrobetaine dioxygenase
MTILWIILKNKVIILIHTFFIFFLVFFNFLHNLQRYGIALVKNVPKRKGSVGKVASRISELRNNMYGAIFDVVSTPNANNLAYTSHQIGFHADLM